MAHEELGNAVRVHSKGRLGGLGTKRSPWDTVWIWMPIILASLIFVGGAPLAAEMVRVKVKTANVRSGPGTKYEKVWQVPKNYPYRVLKRQGRWLHVRDFEGFEDWIYGPLTDHKAAVVVNVKRANIRKGPGTNYPILFTTEQGVPFRVLAKRRKWVKVRHSDGDEGWIFRRLLWGLF